MISCNRYALLDMSHTFSWLFQRVMSVPWCFEIMGIFRYYSGHNMDLPASFLRHIATTFITCSMKSAGTKVLGHFMAVASGRPGRVLTQPLFCRLNTSSWTNIQYSIVCRFYNSTKRKGLPRLLLDTCTRAFSGQWSLSMQ